jgi:serine protease
MVRQLLICFSLLFSATQLFAERGDVLDTAKREVIVKWRVMPQSLDANELLPQKAAQIESIKKALPISERSSSLAKLTVVRAMNAQTAQELVAELNNDSRVEYAEMRPLRELDGERIPGRDYGNSLDAVPNDPYYSQQWGLQAVEAEAAWTEVLGDPSVTIAVVDLGVWFGHPELEATRWQNDEELSGLPEVDDDGNGYIDDFYGYDFISGDGDPTPDPFEPSQSHGTHVAGIAAATRNNGRGIAGIASGCRIMGVRAGQDDDIIYGYEGILYACRSGAKIINCSWGGSSDSQYEREVIQYVLDQGCVIVVSAGNGNTTLPHYPAAIEGVLSVAATGVGDMSAVFSHHGPWVKVSAPGINILSTIWDDNGAPIYAAWQGTSMSAPLVAGICALTAVKFPELSGRELAARVIGSSNPIDGANPWRAGQVGLGRVNAWRAVADELDGVRIEGIELAEQNGNGDDRISPGETAELTISVVNQLSPVDGVIGTITSSLDSLNISNPISVYGSLSTGGPFVGGSPFQMTQSALAARKRSVPITIDWTRGDGRVIGRTVQNVVFDTSWVSVDNGKIRLGFGEDGSLGYHDFVNNVTLGPGLRIEGAPTHTLYHGSFMLGANSQVADNAYGSVDTKSFDWIAAEGEYAHFVAPDRSDLEARASFDDRGSQPFDQLFARVDAAAIAWTDEAARNFLILEYTVTNRSVNPWTNACIGLFMDWDVVASSMNIGGYDAEGDLAYAAQFHGGYSMIGVASLGQSLTTVQTLNSNVEFDPDSAWGDARKWELLNSGIGSSVLDPMEISQIIAYGPLMIDAQGSQTVAFAIVAGESPAELQAAAETARARYGIPVVNNKPAPQETRKQACIYPNPVASANGMKLVLPEEGVATVKFVNILGQLVASYEQVKSGPSGVNLDLSQIAGASGMLFYSIEVNGKQTLGKIVLLR